MDIRMPLSEKGNGVLTPNCRFVLGRLFYEHQNATSGN